MLTAQLEVVGAHSRRQMLHLLHDATPLPRTGRTVCDSRPARGSRGGPKKKNQASSITNHLVSSRGLHERKSYSLKVAKSLGLGGRCLEAPNVAACQIR